MPVFKGTFTFVSFCHFVQKKAPVKHGYTENAHRLELVFGAVVTIPDPVSEHLGLSPHSTSHLAFS